MKCKICRSKAQQIIYFNKNQFIFTQGVCDSPDDERLKKRHELKYLFCDNCGFIFNPNPISSKDDAIYRDLYVLNPQDLSEKDKMNLEIIFKLICQNIGLNRNSLILEIGVNDGFFLNKFNQIGCSCTGIDPSKSTAPVISLDPPESRTPSI